MTSDLTAAPMAHLPVDPVATTGVTPPPVQSSRSRTTERVIGVLALVGIGYAVATLLSS